MNIENIRSSRRKGRNGTQEFFTPGFIVNRMSNKINDKIWENPNTSFFEPCFGDGNFILEILKRKINNKIDWRTALNSIYGIELMEDNVEECKNRILEYLNLSLEEKKEAINIINKNLICGNFLLIENHNHYDVILMNPPYNAGLGEKFLEKCIDIADRIITIQPYTWFIGLRQNNSLLNKIRNKYLEYDKDDEIENAFLNSVGDPMIVGIFYIDNLKETKLIINNEGYYSVLKEWPERIYRFIGIDYLEEFNKSIYEYYIKDNVDKHIKKFQKESFLKDNYIIRVPRIRGHLGRSDMYTMFPNDEIYLKNNSGKLSDLINKVNIKRYIEFNSKEELDGFINYSKTYFFRASMFLSKISQGVADCKGCIRIPWFDFKNEIFQNHFNVIDEYLFDYFHLNHIKDKIYQKLGPFYN